MSGPGSLFFDAKLLKLEVGGSIQQIDRDYYHNRPTKSSKKFIQLLYVYANSTSPALAGII